MKLTAGNRAAFASGVNTAYRPDQSIVCRYLDLMRFFDDPVHDRMFKRHLLDTTIREGARIVDLVEFNGVTVRVLDETSAMATGSLKAIDGCLTAALCLTEGARRIAFESGGNTGSALTRYGRHAGVETFFFCPVENLDLLDSNLFLEGKNRLIGVADRSRLKEFTASFTRATGIRHLPERSWRYAASMLRGLFILEQLLAGMKFDWLIQTISAAFGPIGIYRVLDAFKGDLPSLPRFLGVQQQANCPMYTAWKRNQDATEEVAATQGNLLTRVMYDRDPRTYDTYGDLCALLQSTDGEMLTVDEAEFLRTLVATHPFLVQVLHSRGIPITLQSGEIVEKTGLIALAGTFKAIDRGIIPPGSSVLCCLTGGVTGADGRARPERVLETELDLQEYIREVQGKHDGMG